VPAFRLDLPSFVVGPALLPVSANFVSLIVSAQFMDLDSLVSDPRNNDTPAFSSLDDKLVLRPVRKRKETTSVTLDRSVHRVYIGADNLPPASYR
jgi:hypothetical protein